MIIMCRYLLGTTIPKLGTEPVFKADGSQRQTTLHIVNLRPTTAGYCKWEKVKGTQSNVGFLADFFSMLLPPSPSPPGGHTHKQAG